MKDMTPIRRAVVEASDLELEGLTGVIVAALEGDSNDAEHDALVDVAQFLGLSWEAPE
jgi:tellurite resistance protein